MSLRSSFNDEIKKKFDILEVLDGKVSEIKLLECLSDAINNSTNSKSKLITKKNFYLKSGVYCKKELCDVLLVFKCSDHFRFSFIQLKKRMSRYEGLDKFSIDCGQHYLMTTKPTIYLNGVHTNVLNNSDYDTITGYSVMYYNHNSSEIEIDFSSANLIKCSCENKYSGHCFGKSNAYHLRERLYFKDAEEEFSEVLSHQNIWDIENYTEFGEKAMFDDIQFHELLKILKTFKNNEVFDFLGLNDYSSEDLVNDFLDERQYFVKNLMLIDISNK